MKKIVTVLTTIVMLFASTAFAMGEEKVTPKVKAAFQIDFAAATQVNWEKLSDFYFASFTLNSIKVDAAYNEAGELVGTSRKIDLSQVPLNVSMALSKDYGDYNIAPQVLELNYDGQTYYYISAENNKQGLKLKCYSNGETVIESKVKKAVVES